MSDCETDEQKTMELEDQFILRLPLKQADKLRHILRTKPKKLKKYLAINVDVETKKGSVQIGRKHLPAILVTLPTIIESNKTYDSVHLFKTADVTQMLICDETDSGGGKFEYGHGVAAPLKNVRKKRFRKAQRNRNVEVDDEELEKELLWLIRMDNEAVASKFEIVYEETDSNKYNKDSNNNNNQTERELFGSVISEESDVDSTGSTNDIIEYTN